jgi:hypothetical protein
MQARRYVEQWLEHLLDFRSQERLGVPEMDTLLKKLYAP